MLKQQRRAVAAVVCASAWAALVPAALAAKPATGNCPAGFNLGPVARSDYAALPRSAAANEAGLTDEGGILAGLRLYDKRRLLAGFDRYDKNADGVVCVQLSMGFETNNRPFGQYFYNLVDDTASTDG